LTLRKITKIVATRCQILRLKYIKFNFGWGSAPDPAGGAHKGRGGDGKGRGGDATHSRPPIHISGYAPGISPPVTPFFSVFYLITSPFSPRDGQKLNKKLITNSLIYLF